MSDRIGVLGEASSAAIGTTIVYTTPIAKGTKVRWMFLIQGNAGGGTVVEFFVNGMSVAKTAAITASNWLFSTKGAGLRAAVQASQPDGSTLALTVAPADPIYWLSAGDLLQYTISGAAAISVKIQAVGVEIDV